MQRYNFFFKYDVTAPTFLFYIKAKRTFLCHPQILNLTGMLKSSQSCPASRHCPVAWRYFSSFERFSLRVTSAVLTSSATVRTPRLRSKPVSMHCLSDMVCAALNDKLQMMNDKLNTVRLIICFTFCFWLQSSHFSAIQCCPIRDGKCSVGAFLAKSRRKKNRNPP